MWKYLKVIVKVLPTLVISYFSWIFKYSRYPEKYDIKLRFSKVQKLIRKVLRAFNVSIKDYNLEEFNQYKGTKNRFIICNHISDFDPLIYIAYSKRPITFVAKKEILKYPFVGKIIKCLSGEFIDRNDLKMQLKVFMTIGKKMESVKGLDWLIFPEGTRNKVNISELLEFHYGTFKPAMKNKLDIYVFSMMGSQRILDVKCKNKYYQVPIKLNTILKAEEYQNKTTIEVCELAAKACQKGVDELYEKDMEFIAKMKK